MVEHGKCPHPRVARRLYNGYRVVCGDCGAWGGTVALAPAAVLGRIEAREVLGLIGAAGEGSGVRAKLLRAAEREEAINV